MRYLKMLVLILLKVPTSVSKVPVRRYKFTYSVRKLEFFVRIIQKEFFRNFSVQRYVVDSCKVCNHRDCHWLDMTNLEETRRELITQNNCSIFNFYRDETVQLLRISYYACISSQE